jgi:hypothetical protein
MSEAPLAPQCRHCRATNDSGAAECWMCHRRDWREPPGPPGPPPPRPHRSGPEPLGLGCLFFIAIALIGVVNQAARFGWIVGLAALVLAVLAFAVAIAMFMLCTVALKM